jgi:DNA-binding MarR family transcriptional regulator
MDTTDDELRLLLQKVARRIRNNRGGENVSDSQLSVLFQLDLNGESTPGRLAEYDHLTPPSMNRTLNGLEETGLIARTRSTDDGRVVIVALTAAGRALVAETRRLRTAWFSQRLGELDPDERAALEAAAPVLRKLAES